MDLTTHADRRTLADSNIYAVGKKEDRPRGPSSRAVGVPAGPCLAPGSYLFWNT
jgi:hypothetical protein